LTDRATTLSPSNCIRSRFIRCNWALFVVVSILSFAGANAQTYSVVDFINMSGATQCCIFASAINAHGVSVGFDGVDHGLAFVSDGATMSFIPFLRGGDDGNGASGINDNGLVTGASGSNSPITPAPPHAFLYNIATNGLTDLGTLPGGDTSGGNAINASGQVTGSATVGGSPSEHAFLYSNGAMIDLGTLPGGTSSQGNAINDSGVVLGQANTAKGAEHAFVYSAGKMIDLGTLPGGTSSHGNAINSSGLVVGKADTAAGDTHAFITQGNSLIDLGTLAGGTTGVGFTSEAVAVNNAGQVTGSSSVLPSGRHAFLYAGGRMTDLGTIGGLDNAPSGINNRGQIVGTTVNANVLGVAFLYANGLMSDLNSMIDPNDPLYASRPLLRAVAINDNGWILAGGFSGGDPTNPVTSFLLVPLRFTPRAVTFADQPVGTQSTAQAITLTNLDTLPLTVAAITPSSGFTQSNDCSVALTTGSSCTIHVGFAPSASGSQSGVLKVTTASTSFTLPVALSGSAYTAVSITASATDVTAGTPVTLTWTGSNGTTNCAATGGATGDGWAGTVAANGKKSVVEKTAGTYTYTLTCPVGGVLPQASATVNDTPAVAPVDVAVPGSSGGGSVESLTLAALLSSLMAKLLSPRQHHRRLSWWAT
jgi:probable HAF family extracellular repeat protein